MFLSSLTVSLAIFILTCFVLFRWKQNSKLPPGPSGLPFLGYYPFLTNKLFTDFFNLSKRYGNVFSFRTVGDTLIVVLNGAKTIKDIMVNRSEEFTGRPAEANLMHWISDGMGITQEEGSVWKEHRRFFLQTVKNYGFGKQESEGLIHDEINTLVKDLKNDADEGKESNIRFHITYVVSSVVSSILFSKKFDKHGPAFQDIADSANFLLEMFADQRFMLVGPIYQYVMKLLPSSKRIRKAKKHFQNVIKEIVDEHVSTFDPHHLRDYIDGYLYQAYKLQKSGEENSFTIERLQSICMNMLMEGTESATLCELLAEASRHPDEQKRVQEELDVVVGRERLPSWRDKQNLPYFEAFLQELYRHNVAFKISTHYCNYKETTIQGYRIPPRTIVVANLWTVNNDAELYPDPDKFDTRRFLNESGKKMKTEGPYPFGVGKRSCVGESLAQMEVFLTISALLQNFTMYPGSQHGGMRLVAR